MPVGLVKGLRGADDPIEWAYPPGHSDLWGTPPPTERMKTAQKKIRFAADLFRPIK